MTTATKENPEADSVLVTQGGVKAKQALFDGAKTPSLEPDFPGPLGIYQQRLDELLFCIDQELGDKQRHLANGKFHMLKARGCDENIARFAGQRQAICDAAKVLIIAEQGEAA